MRKRIFWSIYLTALCCVLITALFVSVLMYSEMHESMRLSVQRQTVLAAQLAEDAGISGLENLPQSPGEERITLIAPDGTVLFDNKETQEPLDNHLERPEIKEALDKGSGSSQRSSDTLKQSIYYYAYRLEDGSIIRVSSTIKSIFTAMANSIVLLVLLIIIMSIVTRFISKKMTENLLEPINQLDLEHPDMAGVYPELRPLVLRVGEQNNKIQKQLDELEERQLETTFFLENMEEGIILLDPELNITTVNASAIMTLGARPLYYVGKNLFQLSRNLTIYQAAQKALEGEYQDILLDLDNKKIQLHSSPIWDDGVVVGAICFLLDVTKQENVNQMRRDFSARVSHELKTPLTSISGYAEMMKSGIAKEEDLKRFSAKIYEEAQRLLELINDIMRISQLDEEALPVPFQPVDFYEILGDTVERLEPLAKEKGITLVLEGESLWLDGIPQLLHEISFNLIDNAIKYSKDGTVSIRLTKEKDFAKLTVSDQGIGIDKEHQDHVFERFYREDSSHSKATGGTGLGLAIVKHGVKHHKGTIKLESEKGEGTDIIVSLPLQQTE